MPRSASPVARFLMVKVVSLRIQPMLKGWEPFFTLSWMKASARTESHVRFMFANKVRGGTTFD
jgi:hypothetical protein